MLGFSPISTQPISSIQDSEITSIQIFFSLPVEQSPFYSIDIGNKLCWVVHPRPDEWSFVNCTESCD
jgi:hypothetical protein